MKGKQDLRADVCPTFQFVGFFRQTARISVAICPKDAVLYQYYHITFAQFVKYADKQLTNYLHTNIL